VSPAGVHVCGGSSPEYRVSPVLRSLQYRGAFESRSEIVQFVEVRKAVATTSWLVRAMDNVEEILYDDS
jgi:hypothetical protein